ncbi:MAG: phosphorylase, partial [Oligoflexia bacterium]|nr:phosphorylase [Oligoflexia bacterium]
HKQKVEEKKIEFGFYLISSGRYEFEKEIDFKVKLRRRLLRWYIAHAQINYISSILLLTAIFLFICLKASSFEHESLLIYLLLACFGFFPASEIALTIVNRSIVDVFGPRHIPRLKLSKGVPSHLKTFVVVPTMLLEVNDIFNQVRQLEVHYLSNPDGAIHLALLSDWQDADSEHIPTDGEILSVAVKNINNLNQKYGLTSDGKKRFFIFHRKRKWNVSEQKWIGWERKRGKLHEFNRLLRGATDTSFLNTVEFPLTSEIPLDVRYVITLDADTKIPKGTVTQLVGSMAHPLNYPQFASDHYGSDCNDSKLNRVVDGYGILRTRITPSLPVTKDSTLFQRFFSGSCGIDPYFSAVSDVYQDFFGEGSYVGKGIYDVDVFEKALRGRVPENRLLSHDLFEGNFARCGLLSDVEFVEDFPSHATVAFARIHRWTRGDWQLLPWILGRGGNAISVIGRFKMIDNLRRSLVTPMTLFLLVTVLCISELKTCIWIVLILLSLGISPLLPLFFKIIFYQKKISFKQQLRSFAEDLFLGLGQFLLNIILLPHLANILLDAIGRALFRLIISKRKLLEWTTANSIKNTASLNFKSFIRSMIYVEIFVLLLSIYGVIFFNQTKLVEAVIFIIFWSISPLVAWKISLPPSKKNIIKLEDADILVLRNTARRIWRFFTTFVTAEDNFLPPDNFQEDPVAVISHRSSPT